MFDQPSVYTELFTGSINLDSSIQEWNFFAPTPYPLLTFEVLGETYEVDLSILLPLIQLLGVLLNISAAFLGLRILFFNPA